MDPVAHVIMTSLPQHQGCCGRDPLKPLEGLEDTLEARSCRTSCRVARYASCMTHVVLHDSCMTNVVYDMRRV